MNPERRNAIIAFFVLFVFSLVLVFEFNAERASLRIERKEIVEEYDLEKASLELLRAEINLQKKEMMKEYNSVKSNLDELKAELNSIKAARVPVSLEHEERNKKFLEIREMQNIFERNIEPPTGAPPACMLVRTYRKTFSTLLKMSLSTSFSGEATDQLRLFYVLTESDSPESWEQNLETMDLISNISNTVVGIEGFGTVLPLPYINVSKVDYGYTYTDLALKNFFYNREDTKFHEKYPKSYLHPYDCGYLIVTNGDNYYLKDWLKKTEKHLGSDLAYFNMWSHNALMCVNTSPKVGLIDLGAAMYRLEYIRSNKLFFDDPRSTRDNRFNWDGEFIINLANSTSNTRKIDHFLFVHE